MRSRAAIRTVIIPSEIVLRLNTVVCNQYVVQFTDVLPGVSWFTLSDDDGREEFFIAFVVGGLFPLAP
jgi:hypothetical protein